MNFLIKKNILVQALTSLEGVVVRNTNLPVLANIKITAQKSSITLSATNLELGVIFTIPAQVKEEGEVIFTPRILSSFLGQATDGVIDIKKVGSTLSIQEDRRNATIQLEDTEEFPIIPFVTPQQEGVIPTGKLIPALERVIGSVSVSEAKPELTGVFFSIQKKEWVVAATDGFRLSEVTISQQVSVQDAIQCIIPSQCVGTLLRTSRSMGIEGDLFIGFEDNQVVVRNDDKSVYIVSKIIEGEYPAYTSIIPRDFITSCTVGRQDFIAAVKGAGIFASRANTVRIDLHKGELSVASGEGEVGTFHASVPIKLEGEDVGLTFNYHYLLDGLQNIQEDTVLWKVSKKDGPSLLLGVHERNFVYLVMPIRDL